jgi:hypothetical protein
MASTAPVVLLFCAGSSLSPPVMTPGPCSIHVADGTSRSSSWSTVSRGPRHRHICQRVCRLACAQAGRRVPSQEEVNMTVPFWSQGSAIPKGGHCPGAQTERRGETGLVRALPGGEWLKANGCTSRGYSGRSSRRCC